MDPCLKQTNGSLVNRPNRSVDSAWLLTIMAVLPGWSKMPKKKKKGQKVDANMLGFGTGTNYAALEKLEN